jgi:hypothetical protein
LKANHIRDHGRHRAPERFTGRLYLNWGGGKSPSEMYGRVPGGYNRRTQRNVRGTLRRSFATVTRCLKVNRDLVSQNSMPSFTTTARTPFARTGAATIPLQEHTASVGKGQAKACVSKGDDRPARSKGVSRRPHYRKRRPAVQTRAPCRPTTLEASPPFEYTIHTPS